MTLRACLVFVPVLAVAACSSSSPSSAGGGQGDGGSSSGSTGSSSGGSDAGAGDDGGLLAPPPAGQGVQYTMQGSIAASSEDEQCRFVQTTEDMWVNHEEVRYTPGSHHFIVWNTPYTSIPTVSNSGKTVDTTKVFDCVGGPAADWNTTQFVGGAQSADAPPLLSDLPGDVALHIPAGSVLVLDLHVLNTSMQALNPVVAINFDTIAQSAVKQEAGIYFFYNPFIVVPPNAQAHARMSCPVTTDVNLTTAQTHMHKWGLGGSANLEDASGNVVKPLYTSSVWTDPPVTQWGAPGYALTAGQQIDYECNYENDGATAIVQGLSAATNEMCVFVGAYYPRDATFETCSTKGTFADQSSAATFIGTGTADCTTSMECVSGAQDDATFYGCVTNSCPGIARPFTAALDCFFANGSNAQTACATQISACAATACN